jgi:hypothetical protein
MAWALACKILASRVSDAPTTFSNIFRHLGRRMNVFQPDENDARAHLKIVRLPLDVLPQGLGGRAPPARHQIIKVGAGQVLNHFALGDVGQQRDRVLVDVGPTVQIGDLVLHRDADGKQADRRAVAAGWLAGGRLPEFNSRLATRKFSSLAWLTVQAMVSVFSGSAPTRNV